MENKLIVSQQGSALQQVTNKGTGNSIVIHNALNESSRGVIVATKTGFKISDLNTDRLKEGFEEKVLGFLDVFPRKTGFNKSQKFDDITRADICEDIIEACLKFKWLTVEEFALITLKGMDGELGEFHGINQKTFISWCKSYKEQQRKKALKEHHDLLAEVEAEKERQRKEAEADHYSKRTFERFLGGYTELFNRLAGTNPTWKEIDDIDQGNLFFEDMAKSGVIETKGQHVADIFQKEYTDTYQNIAMKGMNRSQRKSYAISKTRARLFKEKIAELICWGIRPSEIYYSPPKPKKENSDTNGPQDLNFQN